MLELKTELSLVSIVEELCNCCRLAPRVVDFG